MGDNSLREGARSRVTTYSRTGCALHNGWEPVPETMTKAQLLVSTVAKVSPEVKTLKRWLGRASVRSFS